MEKLLSTDELAEYLGIPKGTLYNWNSRGDNTIPRYPVGRHVKYRVSDVEKWLAERKIGGVKNS